MNARNIIAALSLLTMLLSACSSTLTKPIEPSFPTAVGGTVLTSVQGPYPDKWAPTLSARTTSTLELRMPDGKPAAEWGGIPIMPDALAGNGDEDGYIFTVKATVEEIQQYYETAMVELNWKLFASGEGSTGARIIIFIKDSKTASMALFPLEDGLMYVVVAGS